MAIHHDKPLYGKLARMQNELSEEEIELAVESLNAEIMKSESYVSPKDKAAKKRQVADKIKKRGK